MLEKDSMRNQIYKMTKKLVPGDAVEAKDLDFALKWIESGVEIFRTDKPATPDPHLVSYFILLDQNVDQLLLVDHKKSNLWVAPGGHVEPNEHPQDAVKREIKEELGIAARFLFPEPFFMTVMKTTNPIGRHTDVSFWYLLHGNISKILKYEEREFHQIGWFSFSTIPHHRADPCLMRFIAKLSQHEPFSMKNFLMENFHREIKLPQIVSGKTIQEFPKT
jgi:8-oxo-dGTP diphosphatase